MQIELTAFAKHGGPEGLEQARLRRIDNRTEARMKKRMARESKASNPNDRVVSVTCCAPNAVPLDLPPHVHSLRGLLATFLLSKGQRRCQQQSGQCSLLLASSPRLKTLTSPG